MLMRVTATPTIRDERIGRPMTASLGGKDFRRLGSPNSGGSPCRGPCRLRPRRPRPPGHPIKVPASVAGGPQMVLKIDRGLVPVEHRPVDPRRAAIDCDA